MICWVPFTWAEEAYRGHDVDRFGGFETRSGGNFSGCEQSGLETQREGETQDETRNELPRTDCSAGALRPKTLEFNGPVERDFGLRKAVETIQTTKNPNCSCRPIRLVLGKQREEDVSRYQAG